MNDQTNNTQEILNQLLGQPNSDSEEQEDILYRILSDPNNRVRPEIELYIKDPRGGYQKIILNPYREDSACGCVIDHNNPPLYFCKDCKKVICSKEGCSFVCAKCGGRTCINCATIRRGKAYCKEHSHSLLLEISLLILFLIATLIVLSILT